MKPRAPSVTVAILNHCRPHLLARVLCGVAKLDYQNFEIVVVSDQPDLRTCGVPDQIASQIRHVHFVEANICRARNLAVDAAGGDIVAFLDDDAVPEPNWLRELLRGFQTGNVAAVGGLVRASDGIGIEWQGGVFDRAAVERDMRFPDDVRAFDSASQVAGDEFIGVRGTNMAFLREAIQSVGGFDESFCYYLDETDLLLRLAEAGWDTALARTAEVHHLREANATRDRLRTPRNLFQIAASKAYFCKRHLTSEAVEDALRVFRTARRGDLDPHIRLGLVRRAERDGLMAQIDDGIAEGLTRQPILRAAEAGSDCRFSRFTPENADQAIGIALVSGWGVGKIRRTRGIARKLAALGHNVTCLSFLSGTQPRHVSFADGLWFHAGGTWRVDHKVGRKRVIGRRARAEAEFARVARRRRFDLVLHPPGKLDLGVFDSGDACETMCLGFPLVARRTSASRVPLTVALAEIAAVLTPAQGAAAPELPQNQPDLAGKSALPAG